jgi:hypothetical protein
MNNSDVKKPGRGGARPNSGPPKSPQSKSPRSFYASDEEWDQIKNFATEAGKAISEYIRERALKKKGI